MLHRAHLPAETEARVQFLALAAWISNSATREDHAQCVPKSRLTQTFMEVTAFPPEDCKAALSTGQTHGA
jgi:hypothetical protein